MPECQYRETVLEKYGNAQLQSYVPDDLPANSPDDNLLWSNQKVHASAVTTGTDNRILVANFLYRHQVLVDSYCAPQPRHYQFLQWSKIGRMGRIPTRRRYRCWSRGGRLRSRTDLLFFRVLPYSDKRTVVPGRKTKMYETACYGSIQRWRLVRHDHSNWWCIFELQFIDRSHGICLVHFRLTANIPSNVLAVMENNGVHYRYSLVSRTFRLRSLSTPLHLAKISDNKNGE